MRSSLAQRTAFFHLAIYADHEVIADRLQPRPRGCLSAFASRKAALRVPTVNIACVKRFPVRRGRTMNDDGVDFASHTFSMEARLRLWKAQYCANAEKKNG